MNKRLIIDSQLAAQDVNAVFDKGWNWPIAQVKYDRLVTEVIEWSDELHAELYDSPRLLTAFMLIKADLLKDLSYFLVGWIDVAAARENATELLFNSNQYIYSDLVSNQFSKRIPTDYYRSSGTMGLKSAIRARLSRIKRNRNNRSALSSSIPTKLLIGANPLGVEIAGASARRLSLNANDIARRRRSRGELPNRVSELADLISSQVAQAISRNTTEPTKELIAHFRFIALEHLKKGWADSGLKPVLTPSRTDSTLITGTGSNYATRLLSHQFLSSGHSVVRTSHGGDSPLFDDVLLPSIELPFGTKYVVYGRAAASAVNKSLLKRSESKIPEYMNSIIGAGSQQHLRIRGAAVPRSAAPIKNVSVISASFTGMHRVTPHMKLHDVVYMEWHRRLLRDIRTLDYTVISKRHPKGMMAASPIFDSVANEEVLESTMGSIESRTDAYVIDFPASALMESICTVKPVVLIDLAIRRMRPEVRSLLSKSVAIISTTVDQNNRIQIDRNELRDGLETPVNLDARDEFLQEYLLQPSPNADSLFN
jgi:hypothetical protein